jgi:mannosyltransferase OCH1-like enzyme
MNFPRVIFQTWEDENVPEKWRDAQKSVIEKNPNWEYVLITNADRIRIIKENFPELLPLFMSFKHNIMRADMIRYIILYLHGGVYLDLDFIAMYPFDSLKLDERAEVGFVTSKNSILGENSILSNSFMVSKPGSNFWLHCLDEIRKEKSPLLTFTKHLEVMSTTGPFMLTRVAEKYPMDKITILENVVVPCNMCQIESEEGCDSKEPGLVKPIEGSSWNSLDTKIINGVFCNRKVILVILIAWIFLKLSR